MKKYLVLFLFLISSLFADIDFTGVIELIDNDNKTIKVNGTIIQVMQYTKIEQDSCGFGWDLYKKFSDLSVGQIIEVDTNYYTNNIPIAKEIEIKCQSNRAY